MILIINGIIASIALLIIYISISYEKGTKAKIIFLLKTAVITVLIMTFTTFLCIQIGKSRFWGIIKQPYHLLFNIKYEMKIETVEIKKKFYSPALDKYFILLDISEDEEYAVNITEKYYEKFKVGEEIEVYYKYPVDNKNLDLEYSMRKIVDLKIIEY